MEKWELGKVKGRKKWEKLYVCQRAVLTEKWDKKVCKEKEEKRWEGKKRKGKERN